MEDSQVKLVCKGCGASLEYSAGARALKCVYCSAVTEIPTEEDEALADAPEIVVPMAVTKAQLEDVVYQHLAAGKYTPDNLLEHATFSKVEQFYVPAYVFSGAFEAEWTASFGYDRTEHYTAFERDSQGNSRPVTKTKTVTDWRPVNGTDSGRFTVLTYAGSRLQRSSLPLTVNLVELCHGRSDATAYDVSYTSGIEIESFSVTQSDAYRGRGEALVNAVIDESVKQHAQGDHQKDWHWTASISKQCATAILPVCHVVYEYEGKSYEIWTDGTNTTNLVAESSPEDHDRKRSVQRGFIPAALAALAAGGLGVMGGPAVERFADPKLIGGAVIVALLYGVIRRHSILSYSQRLRRALLAQRKLAATNTSELSETQRKELLDACQRPNRPALSDTARDKMVLPLVSAVAMAAVVVPPVSMRMTSSPSTSGAVAMRQASPYEMSRTPIGAESPKGGEAPATSSAELPKAAEVPAAPAAPQPAQESPAQSQQVQPAQAVQPPASAQGQAVASTVALPTDIDAVLQHAAAADWGGVDSLTGRIQQQGTPAAGNRDRVAARSANAEGKAALQHADFEQAIASFKRGVEADPLDLELLNNLGYALGEGGHQTDAVTVLGEVLHRAPRRTAAWANLSTTLAELGQPEQAKSALVVALHYSSQRERTIEFLRQQSTAGRSAAIRDVNAAVYQSADAVPALVAQASPAVAARPVSTRERSNVGEKAAGVRTQAQTEEAYVRQMNQQLERQLKELGPQR